MGKDITNGTTEYKCINSDYIKNICLRQSDKHPQATKCALLSPNCWMQAFKFPIIFKIRYILCNLLCIAFDRYPPNSLKPQNIA